MKKVKEYREYMADCLRMAEKANAKDKATLLRMAEAWALRAEAAEAAAKGSKPDAD